MGRTGKDMDRWLGDGGMPIIDLVGGVFTAYGVDGEDLGWVGGTFTPDRPRLQPPRDHPGRHPLPGARCVHELRHQRRPAGRSPHPGHARDEDRVHAPGHEGRRLPRSAGDVARLAKQVAYGEATVRDADGVLISRATGTFLLHRPDPAA